MGKFAKVYFGVIFAALIGTIALYSCIPHAAKQKRWIIEGYAATPALNLNGHQIPEEVLAGAVDDLSDFTTVFLNHDQDKPIGHVLCAKMDNEKLWVKIEISKTALATWEKIKDGTLSKLSIAVHPIETELDYSDEFQRPYRRVLELVLIEVSVVSVPANRHAKIISWREE